MLDKMVVACFSGWAAYLAATRASPSETGDANRASAAPQSWSMMR